MASFALILPAAGRSTRFNGPRSKLLESLRGQAVIGRAVEAFLKHPDLKMMVIPTMDVDGVRDAVPQPMDGRIRFAAGGESRAHSVLNAVRMVPESIEWVAVHDAARPLVSSALIEATLRAAAEHGAAVPALAAALTIKQADGPLPAKVERTLPRQSLWTMQTPQIMRRADLLEAFAKCPLPLDQITDDVQLLELIQKEVWLIPGEERNLKITTAIDLKVAEFWLDAGD